MRKEMVMKVLLKCLAIVFLLGLCCVLAIPKDGVADSLPNAGFDQCVCVGCQVELDGSKSYIPNPPKEYYWWFPPDGKPSGSTAVLSDQYAKRPTFTADVPGLYKVRLKVRGAAETWQGPDVVQILSKSFCPKIVILDAYTSGRAGTEQGNFKPGDAISYHVIYYVRGKTDKTYKVKIKVRNKKFSKERGLPVYTWIAAPVQFLAPGRHHTILPRGNPDTVPALIDGGVYPIEYKVKMRAHGLDLIDKDLSSIWVRE